MSVGVIGELFVLDAYKSRVDKNTKDFETG